MLAFCMSSSRRLGHLRGTSVKHLVFGLAAFVPGVYRALARTGGTGSPRYCYSIWLRHLVLAHQHGIIAGVPGVVAELGPGDTIGTGIAALISGAHRYFGLDVVRYAAKPGDLRLFEEIAELFGRREPIPDDREFPEILPKLDKYGFPHEILPPDHLQNALAASRLARIKDDLREMQGSSPGSGSISYIAPWFSEENIPKGRLDMIFSQAVLEHVDDMPALYAAMYRSLGDGGFVSHQIDFRSHNTHKKWNGHWGYGNVMWSLIRGGRPYLLNRAPHSRHLAELKRHGFRIVCDLLTVDPNGITRDELAPRFANLSTEDLTTSSAFILASK